jgi:hypothetical protein
MAFRRFPNIIFVGVDIDPNAIAVARSIFRDDPRFKIDIAMEKSLLQYVPTKGPATCSNRISHRQRHGHDLPVARNASVPMHS